MNIVGNPIWGVFVWVGGLALVLFVVSVLVGQAGSVRTKPGYTCGVVGLRGGGKSLFCARLIALRLKQGSPVACNFKVPGAIFLRSIEDAMRVPRGALVVIDEAHQWFPSTGKLPPALANWYISHTRKLGHEVYWIAQHESQVASFLRNQTNQMVLCQGIVYGLHRASSYAPHSFRKPKVKALWRWWYSPRGAAIRIFDTEELVQPVEGKPIGLEESNERIREFIDAYRRGDRFDLEIVPKRAESGGRGTSRRPARPNDDTEKDSDPTPSETLAGLGIGSLDDHDAS